MENDRISRVMDLFTLILLAAQVIISGLVLFGIVNLRDLLVALESEFLPSTVPTYIRDISTTNDPWIGADDAAITIVGFEDFECPYSADMRRIIDVLLEEYPGYIKYVHRDYPLASHPNAYDAAIAAECAYAQGAFWDYYYLLYEEDELASEDWLSLANSLNLDLIHFRNCLQNSSESEIEIERDIRDANNYQVSATPTLFVNGIRVTGANLQQLQGIIDFLLEGGG